MKVVVIDDRSYIRAPVVRLVERMRGQAFEANNELDGLAAVNQCRPEVVVTDLGVGSLGRQEPLRWLKQIFAAADAVKARLIVHSANDDQAVIDYCNHHSIERIDKGDIGALTRKLDPFSQAVPQQLPQQLPSSYDPVMIERVVDERVQKLLDSLAADLGLVDERGPALHEFRTWWSAKKRAEKWSRAALGGMAVSLITALILVAVPWLAKLGLSDLTRGKP